METQQANPFPTELTVLAREIDFAQDDFALYFAQVNSPVQRDKLIAQLKELLAQKQISTIEMAYTEPVRYLLRDIRERLRARGREGEWAKGRNGNDNADQRPLASSPTRPLADPPLCLIITGLEHSIKPDDPNPPLLAHLNLARPFYGEIPHPFVLWLPDYALTALVRIAPDFWAWRSGLFEFETPPIASLVVMRDENVINACRIVPSTTSSSPLLQTADYLAYAEAHQQPSASTYDTLAAELPKLLIYLEQAYQTRQWAEVRRLMWALSVTKERELGFLWVRGYWDELRTGLESAIDAARAARDKRETAAFRALLALVCHQTGDYVEARREYRRALEGFEKLGLRESLAAVYHQLGNLAQERGNYDEAEGRYQQSLQLDEALGNEAGKAKTVHQLGVLAQNKGHYVEARQLYEQSLQIEERNANPLGIARTRHSLARLAQASENYLQAEQLYLQSWQTYQELGHQLGIASTSHQLGNLAQATGNENLAQQRYEDSLAIHQRLGNKSALAATTHQLAMLAQERGDYTKAQTLYEQSLHMKQQLGDPAGIARTWHQLGILAQQRGDYNSARRLYEQSLAISQELGNKVGCANTIAQLASLAQ